MHKSTVTGLTTAAGIWATSGVGLAIGAGMYVMGIFTTVIIILVQILLHKNFKWLRTSKLKTLSIKNVDMVGFQEHITQDLNQMGVIIYDTYIEKGDTGKNYIFAIDIPQNLYEEKIIDSINYNCAIGED